MERRGFPVAHRPVGAGQHHRGDEGPHQREPQRGPLRGPLHQQAQRMHAGQVAHADHRIGRHAVEVDRAEHRVPQQQVDGGQHHADQAGGDRDLDVRAQQVAQVERAGEQRVAQAAGDEVAAVAAQPPAEARTVDVAEGALDLAHLVGRLGVGAQASQGGADVAAARDGGDQVEPEQLPARGQRLEQAEAEGRAADAAARQRQAPGPVGRRRRPRAPGAAAVTSFWMVSSMRLLVRGRCSAWNISCLARGGNAANGLCRNAGRSG